MFTTQIVFHQFHYQEHQIVYKTTCFPTVPTSGTPAWLQNKLFSIGSTIRNTKCLQNKLFFHSHVEVILSCAVLFASCLHCAFAVRSRPSPTPKCLQNQMFSNTSTFIHITKLVKPMVFQQFHPQEHQYVYKPNGFPLAYWGKSKLRCPCLHGAFTVRPRPSPAPNSLQHQLFSSSSTLRNTNMFTKPIVFHSHTEVILSCAVLIASCLHCAPRCVRDRLPHQDPYKTNGLPTMPPSGTPQCLQNQWFPLPYWGISKLRCHKVGSTRTEISCWPKGVMPAWFWFSVWI